MEMGPGRGEASTRGADGGGGGGAGSDSEDSCDGSRSCHVGSTGLSINWP